MKLCHIIMLAAKLSATPALAQDEEIQRIPIEISAQANLYFHEIMDTSMVRGGAGVPPVEIDICGVKMISFEDAEGTVSCVGDFDSTYFGADGGAYGQKTDVGERGALSGIQHNKKVMFVTGVMISEYSRLDPPHPADDYTEREDYEELYPPFNQVFFVGDGKNAKGVQQRIQVRDDATTLYIGFADSFLGPASNYRDNRGTIKMTVVLYRTGKGRS